MPRKSEVTKWKERQTLKTVRDRIVAPWEKRALETLEKQKVDLDGRRLEPGKPWREEDFD